MTASSLIGTNTTPPAPLPTSEPKKIPESTDGSWQLWDRISKENPLFGNPANFCTRVPESNWESFTVTLKSPKFLEYMAKWTHNEPGTGALMTLKDSPWLLSIVIPHQPHFINQPKDVEVFWGYALTPSAIGKYAKKPMLECSGSEIFSELLQELHINDTFRTEVLASSITIPCSMPFITSQFLTRGPHDRPDVIPKGSTNLAFVGQFVEMPLDTVFTVEYSVRGAETAVYGLMGMDREPKSVFKGERDVAVLAKTLVALCEDGVNPA
jgi:oleate hydratase